MAIYSDFSLVRYEDGVLSISLQSPTNVASWTTQFEVAKRFGSCNPLFLKSEAVGFTAGQSGITLVNAGTGSWNVAIASVDTSGLDFGNYAFAFERLNSGFRTTLAEGYLILLPSLEC